MDSYKDGAARIAAERVRQIAVEGFDAEHDDQHGSGQLLRAARCYLEARPAPIPHEYKCDSCSGRGYYIRESWDEDPPKHDGPCERCRGSGRLADTVPLSWPWEREWWKPEDRIGNLVKAGALVAAEIDRLLRARKED